jgi:hypothetical protein
MTRLMCLFYQIPHHGPTGETNQIAELVIKATDQQILLWGFV